MLDNGRAGGRPCCGCAEYRSAPFRVPALAGAAYPANEKALWSCCRIISKRQMAWSRGHRLVAADRPAQPTYRLLRGGDVYAQVWKRATQAAREAELVIMLGTDHYGSDLFSLTRQNYATPFGVLPTDTAIVDRLATVIGEDAAYAGELRHRGEHSLELVAVWLHHMRGGRRCQSCRSWSAPSTPF